MWEGPIVVIGTMIMNDDTKRDPDGVLIEAEQFDDWGGWKLDQQFAHSMGSSYLLAHGMMVLKGLHTTSEP